MPSPDPLSPADLRPGQRVRITRLDESGEPYVYEGKIMSTGLRSVFLYGHGMFYLGQEITQTVEVLE